MTEEDDNVLCENRTAVDPEKYQDLLNIRSNVQLKDKGNIIWTAKKIKDKMIAYKIHNTGSITSEGKISATSYIGCFMDRMPQNMTIKINIDKIYWDGDKQQLIQFPEKWQLHSSHPSLTKPISFTILENKWVYVSLLSYELIPHQYYFFFWIPSKESIQNWIVTKEFSIPPKGSYQEITFEVNRPILTRVQRIPKIIYQTWKTKKIPSFIHTYVETWKSWNPEYDYRFFSDEDCVQFLKEHFPEKVVQAFQMLKVGPYRADLWRYCVLYHTGGVYLDIDSICVLPLSKIISPTDRFVSARDNPSGPQYIYQAFLASEKHHPFLKKAIDQCVHNIMQRNVGYDSLCMTGPGLLGQAINNVLERPLATRYEIGENRIGQHHFRLYDFNNHTRGIIHRGKSIILTKSKEYFVYQKIHKVDFNIHYLKGVDGVFQDISSDIEKNQNEKKPQD